MEAKAALQCGTSHQAALDLAERLIGQWPHAKPPDPLRYSAGLAAALVRYPLKVAEDCCRLGSGHALEREFPPTVASVTAWCENRMAFYRSVASYQGRTPAPQLEPPPNPERAKELSDMLMEMAHSIRANTEPGPLERLQAERRDSLAMTRKSILARGGDDAP